MSGPSLFAPVQSAYDTFSAFVDNAYTNFKTEVEDTLVQSAKNYIPVAYQPLAERIGRAIPETIFMASMITGKLKICAYAYGAARFMWIMLPLGKAFVHGQLDKEPMTEALEGAKQRLTETVKRFSPAILLSCSVNTVCSTILGFAALKPSLFADAFVNGVIARLAYRDTQEGDAATANAQARKATGAISGAYNPSASVPGVATPSAPPYESPTK